MDKKNPMKPIAAVLGTTFAVSLVAAPIANAADNPFGAVEYASGYMVADSHGEGKCGESKGGEGKCGESKGGEGKCGESKGGEGKCGESGGDADKGGEGKCGEGKCGG
jgi:uncharacterized low-complexity protein